MRRVASIAFTLITSTIAFVAGAQSYYTSVEVGIAAGGTKYFLRPLGTEGQDVGFAKRRYTPVSPCFPVGAGVKFWIKGGLNVTIEVADRLTMTDYLDDVSATFVGKDKFSKKPITAALQD